MRTLTTHVTDKLAERTGLKPVTLVEINWGSGMGYYAEKDITVVGQAYEGRLQELSSVAQTPLNSGIGGISVVQVSLDDKYDTSGTIKTIWDGDTIEGVTVEIFLFLEDMDAQL